MKCLGVSVVAALVPLLGCAEATIQGEADAGAGPADASFSFPDSTPNYDAALPDARVPACGDDVRDPGEVCDDGNTVGGDGCSADCQSTEVCGNGTLDLDAGEVCDDMNTEGGDGCSANCRSDETCGNGTLDIAAGEVCDDNNTSGGDGCSANCLSDETCGNGALDLAAGEVCDDNNTIGGDGCSANCLSDETCGNGVFDTLAGEVCDDNNTIGGDGCSANCLSDEVCGNGTVDLDAGEVCDDSNTTRGDGCAFDCRSGAPLLNEDFEPGEGGGISLPGWQMIDVDGRTPHENVSFMTSAWVFGEDGFDDGPDNTIAASTSFYDPSGRADDWLMTPQLSLDAHSTLSWRAKSPDSDFRDGYEVYISTTTATVAGFQAGERIFSVAREDSDWRNRVIDLAALGYANQDVFIAFRNNSNDEFLLLLDDIIVE